MLTYQSTLRFSHPRVPCIFIESSAERKIQSNPLLLIETVRRVGVGGSERARCEASSRGWRGSVLEYVTEPDKARNEADRPLSPANL